MVYTFHSLIIVMQSQVVKGPGASGNASGHASGNASANASESYIASFCTKITTNPQAKGIVVIVTNGNVTISWISRNKMVRK